MEAATQRLQMLDEKVNRLQAQLDVERKEKHSYEVEVLHLRDENVRLRDECQSTQRELSRFTEWFNRAVDSSSGLGSSGMGNSGLANSGLTNSGLATSGLANSGLTNSGLTNSGLANYNPAHNSGNNSATNGSISRLPPPFPKQI